jgi:hypothetical protein
MTMHNPIHLTKDRILFLALLVFLALLCNAGGAEIQSLQGTWNFRLDPENTGIEQKWFDQALTDTIPLPGSTDEAKKGEPNTAEPTMEYLYRLYPYTGAAWYQREIEIPASWQDKRITLELERCHWETRVWMDGIETNMQDSLCVPHVHELGMKITPGRRRLTIRVDNSLKYDMGRFAHSTSEQTQTNWNGIIGQIALKARARVWIERIWVDPDVEKKSARVELQIGNATGKPVAGNVTLQARCKEHETKAHSIEISATDRMTTFDTILEMGDKVMLWDEFSPNIYELTAKLAAGEFTDESRAGFGMRKLAITPEKQFSLNGRTIFLRGTLECCIFPRTGYPPTDAASWIRILKICQSYGLNHMRFHSWCPPEAAFAAADQLGFILQPEAPCWIFNWGKDVPRDKWVEKEVLRILDCYGNHPSFGMLSMGNEPAGDLNVIYRLVDLAKAYDPRRFYMSATGYRQGAIDEYIVIGNRLLKDSTDEDFREADAKETRPVISHEVGQWTIFPNLAEMPKYDGVLRARNFEIVENDLKAKGLLDQAADFTRATGLQMVQLYKENIEAMLRTPGHAGFQLLDLHDFPGQGTALVGTLDPFWDSKGLIEPEAWLRFCGPVVPLLRMPKRIYTTDETFKAAAELAQFGRDDMRDTEPVWSITNDKGEIVAQGKFDIRNFPTGKLLPLGQIEAPLAKAAAPARLTVSVALKGTGIANDWNIWVYPARLDLTPPEDVVLTQDWDDETQKALSDGKKVLLLTKGSFSNSLPGSFKPVFWSPVWFKRRPDTMSLLCDPKHPALAGFPTESYSNWQWYDLLNRSSTLILDDMPQGFRPVVQVIDNFMRNHRLGNILEARMGRGKLMICSIDLTSDLEQRPEARQLLRSIYDYMGSDAFDPHQTMEPAVVDKVMAGILAALANIASVKADSAHGGNEAIFALDGDPTTIWHTSWGGEEAKKPFPHELVIEFIKPVLIRGVVVEPRQDRIQNGWIKDYAVYVSSDGKEWGEPVARGEFPRDRDKKQVEFGKEVEAKFLKLEALSNFSTENNYASVAEIELVK